MTPFLRRFNVALLLAGALSAPAFADAPLVINVPESVQGGAAIERIERRFEEVHRLFSGGDRERALAEGEPLEDKLRDFIADRGSVPTDPSLRFARLLLAHLYLDIIVDEASWSVYDPRLEQVIYELETDDPDDPDYRYVVAKRLTLYPVTAGGDPETAHEILATMTGRSEVPYWHARALLEIGSFDRAIATVTTTPRLRTHRGVLDQAITLVPGQPLERARVRETEIALTELSSINVVTVEYDHDAESNVVGVRIAIDEKPPRTFGVLLGSTLFTERGSARYDGDNSSPITPLLYYSDQNLFGRMVDVEVITAGIVWQATLGTSDLFGSGLRGEIGGDALVLPLATVPFRNSRGSQIGPEAEYSYANGRVALGAGLGPLLLTAEYRVGREVFDTSSIQEDERLPDDIRHTVSTAAVIDQRTDVHGGTAGAGAYVSIAAAATTFSGFRSWGNDSLMNSRPGNGNRPLAFTVEGGYGSTFGSAFDSTIRAAHAGGAHYYTRTLHLLGSPFVLDDSAIFVRGVPAESVPARSCTVAHFDGGATFGGGAARVGTFFDTAWIDPPSWFADDPAWIHATGATAFFRLPWSLELHVTYAISFTMFDDGRARNSIDLVVVRLADF